jgi:aerobic C4-dicarboxylate transport protein
VASLRKLYVQVLIGIAAGIVLGFSNPAWGLAVKPLGDAFVALLRMLLAPIIFCSVVHGIASVRDIGRLGRMGIKALIYFEVVSTIGLILGWAVVTLVQPGAGLHVASSLPEGSAVSSASAAAGEFTIANFLLSIIPRTLLGALVSGEILQVLFVSILVGIALSLTATRDSVILRGIEEAQTIVFRILGFIMRDGGHRRGQRRRHVDGTAEVRGALLRHMRHVCDRRVRGHLLDRWPFAVVGAAFDSRGNRAGVWHRLGRGRLPSAGSKAQPGRM